MGIFAIPVKDMKLMANDASILPVESGVRSGLEMYTDSFSTGGTTINSIIVSIDKGRITDQPYLFYLGALQKKLMEQKNIKQVSSIAGFVQGMDQQQASAFLNGDPARWPPGLKPMIDRYVSRDGRTAVLDMNFLTDGSSQASQALMEEIRQKIVPESKPPAHLSFAYGGNTPRAADMNQAIYDGLLPALFIMLGLTFLILIATFRSLLLPLKAILMNLLSVGATFGIVTWVFGSGHGIEIFGAEANGYITNFVPLLMLALLFGLSTDYEVFLVSRMKEHYEKTGNNEESIKVGIQSTGPLITGAAFLMIAVFTGFAFSSMLPIQTLGFGLAVAIFLDSTIVRMIIVPAAMKLLGHLNWWYPGNKSIVKIPGNDDQQIKGGIFK
jgi:RND superfamily putative drug exporter